MKFVALLLLIANLVFFAWQFPQQKFMGQPANTTGTAEHQSGEDGGETLMMLEELPSAVAEKVVTVELGKKTSRNTSTSQRVKQGNLAECWSLGPFADAEQADHGLTLLTANGIKGRTQRRSTDTLIGYRVRLASQDSRRAAQEAADQLTAKGIKDIALVPDGDRFMIALGFFKHSESAQKRVRRISSLGYKPIMEEITRKKSAYWLDLYTATSATDLDTVWPALVKAYPDIRREPLKCP